MTTQFTHPPPGTWNARNLLTVPDVAEWARVHPKTVYRWIKEGKLGFRQAAYEAGAARQPGKKYGAPAQKVAKYSRMSLRTFRRYSTKPDNWLRLRGLVIPVDEKPRWQHGSDNHPHRSPRFYRVAMTLPLTPLDEFSLRAWLYKQLAQGKTDLHLIK